MESTPQKTLYERKTPAPEKVIHGDFENISKPEEFIQAVDFKVLNDIFDEIQAKSVGNGPVNTTGHKVIPEKISFLQAENNRDEETFVKFGEAILHTGEIKLWWETNPAYFSNSETLRALYTFKTLLHEATHVRGGYKEEIFTDIRDGDLETHVLARKGVEEHRVRSAVEGTKYKVTGLSLNEAITENIARQVVQEYLLRTGNSGYLKDRLIVKELGRGSYASDRIVLAVVIQVLALHFNASEEEVWRGFAQAYMSGNMELEPLLNDLETEFSQLSEISELLPILASDSALVPESNSHFMNLLNNMVDPDTFDSPLLKRMARELQVRIFDDQKLSAANFKNVLGLR